MVSQNSQNTLNEHVFFLSISDADLDSMNCTTTLARNLAWFSHLNQPPIHRSSCGSRCRAVTLLCRSLFHQFMSLHVKADLIKVL